MQDRQSLRAATWHVLRAAEALEGCNDAVIDQLSAASRLQTYASGAVVATRGSSAQHLIVVADGALEIGITSAEGKRHVLNWIGRGQLFGLIPVLEDGPMIHTATTVRPSCLLLLPRDDLMKTLQDHPPLAMHLIYLVCQRARVQYEMLAAQALLSLPVRLIRLLMVQLEEYPDGRIVATQTDLADVLGVARQSLNQELRKLEREGLLSLGRGEIFVLDRKALSRKAGE